MGMNFKETKQYLPHISKTNLVPCLLGPTGVGKTELFDQMATEEGKDLIIIHVAQLEPSDFVGLYKINSDGKTSNCSPNWLPYREWKPKEEEPEKYASLLKEHNGKEDSEEFLNAVKKTILPPRDKGFINPNGGYIFLDEINRGHEDMRQAMYQFLQTGRIHTYEKPKTYDIVSAANPPSEGYECYEFDPALCNRLSWVNFRPSFEEMKDYLISKYGRNPVLSFVDSNKTIVDTGKEFIPDTLTYSPRMVEMHLILFNSVRKERKDFQKKVFETIMPATEVTAFLAYMKELDFINYIDVMNGLPREKQKKLDELVKDGRLDILSTITMDLGDFFSTYTFKEGKEESLKDHDGREVKINKKTEHDVMIRVRDFLLDVSDELVQAFMDCLKNHYDVGPCIAQLPEFRKPLKEKQNKFQKVMDEASA